MAEKPDVLPRDLEDALARARPRLGPLGSPVLYFTTVGSTNDVASALALEGDLEGAVVIAGAQTAGRGRRGRSWFSPPGSGLYVSVVLAPRRARVAPDRATLLLTLAAGVALSEAIETATGLTPDIKWPNDLLVGRRKVAGILAERFAERVVLGYGVNVGLASYPAEIAGRVTTLELELGCTIDRAALFAETIAALAARYADLLAGRFDAILDGWHRRSAFSRGTRVSWESASGRQAGVTEGVDDQGALLVRVGDRVERIVAGEVVWA